MERPPSSRLFAGKYRVVERIGGGGMGDVFEARHLSTGRRIALKVIRAEASDAANTMARFRREARAAGAIDSRHIARVHDAGVDEDSGSLFLVMDLLSGEDLQHFIKRLGRVPVELALRIAAQICVGLAEAHASGVVHRDIKPANIYLAREDRGEVVVKLLDFGVAKLQAEVLPELERAALTQTGAVLGSPLYMSPEQVRGSKELDGRADLWSLGVVLYQMVAGATPFAHSPSLGSLVLSICTEPTPLVAATVEAPAQLDDLLQRALAKEVRDRFQSADEMLASVRALLLREYRTSDTTIDGTSVEPREAERSQADAPPATTGSAITTTAVASTSIAPARPRRALRITIGAALAVAGLVGARRIGALSSANHATSLATAPSPAPARTSEPVAPSPTLAPSPPQPVASTTTVRLAVSPASASVEVDGKRATNRAGVVDLTGALGSVLHVRVAQGGKESQTEIVIATTGAVPSSIDLRGAAPRAPSAPTEGTSRKTTSQEASRLSAAPSSAPVPTPDRQIDRDFR
jgi:serine/threonine-protein kinase